MDLGTGLSRSLFLMHVSVSRLADLGEYQRWEVCIGKTKGEVICLPGLEEDALNEMLVELGTFGPRNPCA